MKLTRKGRTRSWHFQSCRQIAQKLRAQITKRIAGIRAINRLSGGCCFGLREANLLCRFDCRLGGSVFRVPFGRAKGPQAIAQIQATHRQNSGDD